MNAQLQLLPFSFETKPVRILIREEIPWFVANDVCRTLEIANSRDAISRLDEDEKTAVGITDALVRQGFNDNVPGNSLNLVNESGLYALIFRSRKPSAKRFRKWVTAEVLPTIRKTGSYTLTISPAQQHELQVIVARRAQDLGKLRAEIWSRFDNHFRIARYSQLPTSKFEEAKTYLETLVLRGRDDAGFRIDSVSICYLPSLPEEDGTFSRKFGERVISALWAWSRETNSEPVHREVSRGLDLLSRVMGRAATEMDEAALHLALAEKYLKRWRTGGTKEAARAPKSPAQLKETTKKSSVPAVDPLITVELFLAVWKKVLARLGIDPALPVSEIRTRIESLN